MNSSSTVKKNRLALAMLLVVVAEGLALVPKAVVVLVAVMVVMVKMVIVQRLTKRLSVVLDKVTLPVNLVSRQENYTLVEVAAADG